MKHAPQIMLIAGAALLWFGGGNPNGIKPVPDPIGNQDKVDECVVVFRQTVAGVLRDSVDHEKDWLVTAYQSVLLESFGPVSDAIAEAAWNEKRSETAQAIEGGTL